MWYAHKGGLMAAPLLERIPIPTRRKIWRWFWVK